LAVIVARTGGDDGLDAVEKADEFLVPMARHALADHRSVEDIHAANSVWRRPGYGHCPGPTLLHRQARRGAVERLNLRLLVD